MGTTTRRGTTKSLGRKHASDKFYTRPEVARACIELADVGAYDEVIEPSAGGGAFSHQIPGCLAYDIEPDGEGIVEQDWFDYERERDPSRRVLVIGNPPFGEQSRLAVRFINHAARFADTVAFILPVSFGKHSVQDRLDRHLHRAVEFVLPPVSFSLEGKDYAVPAVFQVWHWREELRERHERRMTSPYFRFVTRDEADLRIQRIGGRAGTASTDLSASAESNYFIKIEAKLPTPDFVALVNRLAFPGRDLGVGPRTISKDELVRTVDAALEATGTTAE